MNLQGKTIIITGAARIGQTIAKDLKNKGANLVITYLHSPSEAGDLGFAVKADVSKKEDIEQLVKAAKEKFGTVDGLIHMAAIYQKSLWQDMDETHWDNN